MALLSWILVSPASPLKLFSPDVRNALGVIHIIPFILTMMLSGSIHRGSEVAYWILVLAQWFIVGFVLALLFRALRGRHNAV